MKKAFTMVELVFVIILVGILSFFISESLQRNTLQEAADQVISHIRYTQHLAMMDEKFIPNATVSHYKNAVQQNKETQFWYKGRWQILFFNVNGETPNNSFTAYAIFSDSPSTTAGNNQYDGNPNQSNNFHEVARNPNDNMRYLIGANHASFTLGTAFLTKNMNLNETYGISQVTFAGGCNTANRVTFDYLGRPFQGNSSTMTSSYGNNRLIVSDCNITLAKENGQNIVITVSPETGYSYISRKSF